ncbi:MAG: hypothetical protein R2681_09055 [Pyrinomonadaceae bacterium]
MNEENFTSEFNLKFETIEETLKYIADSQLKAEWALKQESVKSKKRMDSIEKNLENVSKNLDHISKHLTHITRVLGFNIEEYQFQEDKLQKAGNILQEKRPQ